MPKSKTKTASLILQASDVRSSTKTFQLSKKYVKRLVKISVLNIAYQRIKIKKEEFDFKDYEKIPYVIPKRKSSNKFIRTYHSISIGILDAIEKDYLKQVSVFILRKTTREPLETYQLKIKYNKADAKSDQKPAKVKEATMEYLKTLMDLPGKKWEEEKVELFVELSYNDDVPREYEPPNFEAAKETVSSGTNTFVSLGSINTGFHKISTWGRGHNFSISRPSTPAPSAVLEDSQDITNYEEEEEINFNHKKRGNKDKNENRPDKKRRTAFLLNSTDEISCDKLTISSDEYINCPCQWELPEKYETIKCTRCFDTVHLACHGFMSQKAVDKNNFTCFSCSGTKNIKDLSNIMKLRIILYGININKCIPDELNLATIDESDYIVEQLEKFGIRNSKSTSPEDVDFAGLQKAIQLVFQNEESQYLE